MLERDDALSFIIEGEGERKREKERGREVK